MAAPPSGEGDGRKRPAAAGIRFQLWADRCGRRGAQTPSDEHYAARSPARRSGAAARRRVLPAAPGSRSVPASSVRCQGIPTPPPSPAPRDAGARRRVHDQRADQPGSAADGGPAQRPRRQKVGLAATVCGGRNMRASRATGAEPRQVARSPRPVNSGRGVTENTVRIRAVGESDVPGCGQETVTSPSQWQTVAMP